jgi:hypothetical protein
VSEVERGAIRVPTGPGIGVIVLEGVIHSLATRRIEFRA